MIHEAKLQSYLDIALCKIYLAWSTLAATMAPLHAALHLLQFLFKGLDSVQIISQKVQYQPR